MKNLKINGKLVLMSWKNKDDNDCRALAVDLGYTKKFLTFKTQDIAEVLGLSVFELVKLAPCDVVRLVQPVVLFDKEIE